MTSVLIERTQGLPALLMFPTRLAALLYVELVTADATTQFERVTIFDGDTAAFRRVRVGEFWLDEALINCA